MTTEEKLGAAIVALRMILYTPPNSTWEETSYNNGHDVDCPQCTKMLTIAEQALKALGEVK